MNEINVGFTDEEAEEIIAYVQENVNSMLKDNPVLLKSIQAAVRESVAKEKGATHE